MSPTCRFATEDAPTLPSEQLTAPVRFHLWLHRLLCSNCRRYARQMRITRQVLQSFRRHDEADPELRSRILADWASRR